MSGRRRGGRGAAFTLIELLVTVSILAVLAAVTTTAVQAGLRRAQTAQCLATLRRLGHGILLYTQEEGEFPRSLHSAAAEGRAPWGRAILPYLGYPAGMGEEEAQALVPQVQHCPACRSSTPEVPRYALNVFFELTPEGDDYAGAPATWRRPVNVERPARTILLAEPRPVAFADHVMCHQWVTGRAATNALDGQRHDGKSNFLFADGHAETLAVAATFDPARKVNWWNPSLAGL